MKSSDYIIPKDGKALKIAGGRPITEAFLNSFFKVFSVKQLYGFEGLYQELEPKLRQISMSPEQFMKQVRDSYMRYQEYKKLDSFTPMDKKAYKYVEEFIRKSIEKTHKMVVNARK